MRRVNPTLFPADVYGKYKQRKKTSTSTRQIFPAVMISIGTLGWIVSWTEGTKTSNLTWTSVLVSGLGLGRMS